MEKIKIHEKIKVEILTKHGSVTEQIFAVIEERDSKILTLSLLPFEKFPMDLKQGVKVRGIFIEGGNLFTFDSKVVWIGEKINGSDKKKLVKLAYPREIVMDELHCYQEMGFTGVEGFISFKYGIVKRGEMSEVVINERGAAIWLGGDGLIMINVELFPLKTLLAIAFELPKQPDLINLFGTVTKIDQKEDLYRMEIHFEGLREKDRDTILGYILARQGEMRRLIK